MIEERARKLKYIDFNSHSIGSALFSFLSLKLCRNNFKGKIL